MIRKIQLVLTLYHEGAAVATKTFVGDYDYLGSAFEKYSEKLNNLKGRRYFLNFMLSVVDDTDVNWLVFEGDVFKKDETKGGDYIAGYIDALCKIFPYDATNGEIFEKTYNNEIDEIEYSEDAVLVKTKEKLFRFDKDWWNNQYERGE